MVSIELKRLGITIELPDSVDSELITTEFNKALEEMNNEDFISLKKDILK